MLPCGGTEPRVRRRGPFGDFLEWGASVLRVDPKCETSRARFRQMKTIKLTHMNLWRKSWLLLARFCTPSWPRFFRAVPLALHLSVTS
jgi:hypothetical protein